MFGSGVPTSLKVFLVSLAIFDDMGAIVFIALFYTAQISTPSLITVIGFTMSLFIGSLCFEETDVNFLFDERLGIIVGSLLSAVSGYLLLNRVLPKGNME